MIYGIGINDMPRGWTRANEWNHRVYKVWNSMIERCYSEKYHEKRQTYKNCYCCERWLRLSNFVEDIVKIDNYQYWLSGLSEKRNPYQLDKDIKSNGQNKCYCLENCMFASHAENMKQANKTRDNEYLHDRNPMYNRTGENHPMYNRTGENNPSHGQLVAQIDKDTDKIINLKYNREYIKLGFSSGNITNCCKKRRKTSQGYIWKYISDCTKEQLNEYYERV